MRNRKTYFLDLQTLLTYLSGQSCELTTELKVSEKAARGFILLQEGKIVHCLLSLQNGFQITGEQAFKQLETCTEWQVELEQTEEKKKSSHLVQFSPQPAPAPFLSTPPVSPLLRQKRPLDLAFLQNLPVKERLTLHTVFAMVNGNRSIDEIKAQLRLSPRDIDNALNWLYELGVIE